MTIKTGKKIRKEIEHEITKFSNEQYYETFGKDIHKLQNQKWCLAFDINERIKFFRKFKFNSSLCASMYPYLGMKYREYLNGDCHEEKIWLNWLFNFCFRKLDESLYELLKTV